MMTDTYSRLFNQHHQHQEQQDHFCHPSVQAIEDQVNQTINSLILALSLVKEEWKNIEIAKESIQQEKQSLYQLKEELRRQKEEFLSNEKLSISINEKTKEQIQINVGGELFSTTRSTLCSIEGTMLSAMFSGRHPLVQDSEGRYFLDRDPKFFRPVLRYLQDRTLILPYHDASLCQRFLEEFDYFCVPVDVREVWEGVGKWQGKPMEKDRSDGREGRWINRIVINDMEFSCVKVCGGKIVCGSRSGVVRVIDEETTEDIVDGTIECIDLAGHFLVGGGHSSADGIEMGVAWVWDLRNWGRRKQLCHVESADSVACVKVSRLDKKISSALVVTGGDDAAIKVWRFPSGNLEHRLTGHSKAVSCMDINGSTLVSGSMDCTARVWNLDTGECLRTLSGHMGWVDCLRLTPSLLVTGSADGSVRVWDLHAGTFLVALQQGSPVSCLDAIGGLIVCGVGDCIFKVWDIEAATCRRQIITHFTAGDLHPSTKGLQEESATEIVRDLIITASKREKALGVWHLMNSFEL